MSGGFLDRTQLDAWRRDGFLRLSGFLPETACTRLEDRARELARTAQEELSVFSTRERRLTSNAHFLASAERVSFFLEEDALDSRGKLRIPIERAINKIGHALHELDPVFAAVSDDPRLPALCADLGLEDPRAQQSMLIFKQPGIGGEVQLHQDASFLYTDPVSVVGLWLALEPARRDNGCLWGLPGGHRFPLYERFRRLSDDSTRMERLESEPMPAIEPVPLEADAGDLLLLHGLLPHRSGSNRSQRSRLAYLLHVIDGRAHYAEDNWLQRSRPAPTLGPDR